MRAPPGWTMRSGRYGVDVGNLLVAEVVRQGVRGAPGGGAPDGLELAQRSSSQRRGPGGLLPRRGGFLPRRGGFLPHRGGFLPHRGGLLPQRGGFLPQRGGFLPQRGGFLPQRGGFLPHRGGLLPHRGGLLPHRGGFLPRRGGFLPRRGGFLPHRGGLLPYARPSGGPKVAHPDPPGGLTPHRVTGLLLYMGRPRWPGWFGCALAFRR